VVSHTTRNGDVVAAGRRARPLRRRTPCPVMTSPCWVLHATVLREPGRRQEGDGTGPRRAAPL